MDQAIRDLYQELLRLKASGTQSLYVDSQSIQALLAVRNQKNQQCGETVSIQSQHLSIKKSQEKNLSHTVTLPTKEKQLQPTNIQLPKGSRSEQLLWLEKQYFDNFNTLHPTSYLFGSGSEQAEILVCRYQGEVESEKSQQSALLSKVFKAMELERHSIYITHLVKCLPNEDPIAEIALEKSILPDEHRPYLMAQIECIQPKILLADEPTGNLDPDTAKDVFYHLAAITRATGTAALVVTHNQQLALNMDSILTIEGGKVISIG